ncbi:DUF4406 domain-containing protein [Gordonibacter sp.]|uniref:DUF4406 domain-containing protein n=1 Tax=Gordonibacter sp. TaxID=1968902 RepID=UPI002FC9C4D3
MRLYIAGPVSGIERLNRPAFERAATRLEDAGYSVAVPHWFVPATADWQTAMRISIETLAKCDGVALLPGWRTSRGAKIEQRLAVDLGMEAHAVRTWRVEK